MSEELLKENAVKTIDELIADLKAYHVGTRLDAALYLRLRSKEALKAIPALIEAVEDSDLAVRTKAAEALIEIDETAAVDALIKILQSSDPNKRYSALFSLGQIGEKAIPALNALTTALAMETEIDLREYLEDIINALVNWR